jgi:hypothetical protein
MPDQELNQETDKNPETVLEDTEKHGRLGFFVNDSEELSKEADPPQVDKPPRHPE